MHHRFVFKKELEQGMVSEEKNRTRVETRMLTSLQKLWQRSADIHGIRKKLPV
jgi:hypothetical protein